MIIGTRRTAPTRGKAMASMITSRGLKKTLFRAAMALLLAPVLALAALYLLDLVFPFPRERIDDRIATTSSLIHAADGTPISWRVDRDENRRINVGLDAVSPWLIQATVAVEDKRFHSHLGVDPVAVGRAMTQNISSRRRVSGASTLTMQTIRLLWPRPRTMGSKLIEAFRAWQLERLADKDRILEIYLNLAPYGGNIVGVEAASRRYFAKSAASLNLAEAALLAGLPQSPSRLNPLLRPEAALRRRNHVVERMLEDGYITPAEAERVSREELSLTRMRPRAIAPHFADYVLARTDADSSTVTTLDARLQEATRSIAARHAGALAAQGVSGSAVVVLSLADSSIAAYVGNAAPEGSPARQVDAARINRQPGSLLKPFIFGLLAEEGGISPSSRVYDLPRAWGDYAPQNMDRQWRGALPAGEALRQSRNITAVNQLNTLGAASFGRFLADLGLNPGNASRQGLSMALGTGEQSLLGLTNAYAALGRLGEWLPVKHLRNAPPPQGKRVLSPAASWLTISALALPEDKFAPRIVWKTGTSWNQLDAWAVAMTPEYAVGVWCGRLERGGAGWVAGGMDALPLALEVLDAAMDGDDAKWPRPDGIEIRDVCVHSGAVPGWSCEETTLSPVIAGASRRAVCRDHGPSKPVPASATAEPGRRPEAKLRIISPGNGEIYVAGNGTPLPLRAEGAKENELTWFLNGRLLNASRTNAGSEWQPIPGRHRISVTDGKGESAAAVFIVQPR